MPAPQGRTGRASVLLLFVLLLVLGSFGLLVAALVTSQTSWAWGSVAASLLAGVLLATDWLVRRNAGRAERIESAAPAEQRSTAAEDFGEPHETVATEAPEPAVAGKTGTAEKPELPDEVTVAAPTAATDRAAEDDVEQYGSPSDTPTESAEPAVQRSESAARRDEPSAPPAKAGNVPADLDPTVEPDEEDTDAADVIAVSDLTYEVVVIDERPRYHLARCDWLAGRQTIPLPVREARELGFTPCAICTPDAKLAAKHRLARPRS